MDANGLFSEQKTYCTFWSHIPIIYLPNAAISIYREANVDSTCIKISQRQCQKQITKQTMHCCHRWAVEGILCEAFFTDFTVYSSSSSHCKTRPWSLTLKIQMTIKWQFKDLLDLKRSKKSWLSYPPHYVIKSNQYTVLEKVVKHWPNCRIIYKKRAKKRSFHNLWNRVKLNWTPQLLWFQVPIRVGCGGPQLLFWGVMDWNDENHWCKCPLGTKRVPGPLFEGPT